jgi:hypothetical protein
MILLLTTALSAFAAERVTVAELEKTVFGLHRKSDATAARQLAGLQLTERLSTPRLEELQSELPGDEARQALIAIADAAAFLELPASDVPATPVPDRPAQDAILARAMDFVENTIPTLPNFFATQQTFQFSDAPVDAASQKQTKDRRLRLVGNSRATVRYIAGREELAVAGSPGKVPSPLAGQPIIEGVFALAYGVVLRDAFSGAFSWRRWETEPDGPAAVFHYDVPLERSHYNVPVPGEEKLFMDKNPYGGEIAIDPASGAILRMTFVAVRDPATPVAEANILIEYGPVDIGGKTYICPVRSVALSLSRALDIERDIYKFSQSVRSPYFLHVNDVTYTEYHRFQTEMRMLPADGSAAGGAACGPPATPSSIPPAPPNH